MTRSRKPTAYQLRELREGIKRGGLVTARPNSLASMALAGWVEPTHSPRRARITEAGRRAANDSPAPVGTSLMVQMRGVVHRAVETASGCACECGAAAPNRDALARAHQRSPRVIPAVYEAQL